MSPLLEVRAARRALFGALVGALSLVAPVEAQDERRVPFRVTSVAGNAIFLNLGRSSGLEVGDRVVLRPLGRAPITTRLTVVSKTSARAELPAGTLPPADGTEGEVFVPAARLAPQVEERPQPAEGPEHPPWSAPLEGAPEDVPLLAPIRRIEREERPTNFTGRLFTRADFGASNEERYDLYEVGIDTRIENPFGDGGTIDFRGVGSRLPVSVFEGGADESDSRMRLERFSYRSDDSAERSFVWQIGRFYPVELPEIGLFDGAVGELRLGDSQVIGAGAGFLPDPFDLHASGKNSQVFAFHGLRLGEEQEFRFTWGFQKTWNDGDEDRDVFLAVLDWRPFDGLFLHGNLWVDHYDASDALKDPGFELTEAHLTATYQIDDATGVRAGYSSIRWPQLLRLPFLGASDQLVSKGHLQRSSVGFWREFGEYLRVDGNANRWEDQDDSGIGGDLRFALRDLLWERGEASITAFHLESAYSEGNGARLRLLKSWTDVQLSGSYEVQRQTLDLNGEELLLQAVTVEANWYLSDDLDLSLFLDRRFGDSQDGWTASLYTQWRF